MRHENMKTRPQNHRRCIAYLAAWCLVIQIAAQVFTSSLSRISYPQPIDMLILAFIPVGAFHAAKFARTGIVFTAYGGLASSAFWFNCLYHRRVTSIFGDSAVGNVVITACLVSVVLMVASRLAAVQRGRLAGPFRRPPGHCQTCGYDLTGNVSGVCPECGEAI